jgi:LDH2 family malate/lactate/ureidoglycolate dehydrogenase
MRLPWQALEDFTARLMLRAGVDAEQAGTVARNLVWNDAAGRRNHGLNRLPVMLDRVRQGGIACPCRIEERPLGPGLAHMDGGDGFGQHVATRAMERALALCAETGLAGVGVSGSNFFGSGAAFVAMAAEAGYCAFAFSNSFPKVAVPGGHAPALGTNPLAFAAPGGGGPALIVDMSTAALAGSTLRAHRQAGTPLPEGMAVDAAGRPVTDPAAAAQAVLLPAAGAKGFGLALMVEVLAGVLTGAGIGQGARSMYADRDRPGASGHFFLVLDGARFMGAEAYAARMAELRAQLAAATPGGAARLPGDVRAEELARARAEGVLLAAADWQAVAALARDLDVPLPG